MFPTTKPTERVQSGLKKINGRREIEGVSPADGVWSSFSLAHFTFCNVALLREPGIPTMVCVVPQYWMKGLGCNIVSVTFEWPSGVALYICCVSRLSHDLLSLTFHFCSKFAFSFSTSWFYNCWCYLRWVVVNFIVCSSLVNTVLCFIDYIIVLLYRMIVGFFMFVQKSQVVLVVFKGPIASCLP